MSLFQLAERYNEMSDEVDNLTVLNDSLEMELHDATRELHDCQNAELDEEDED